MVQVTIRDFLEGLDDVETEDLVDDEHVVKLKKTLERADKHAHDLLRVVI